ncbi:hypothetical protein [Sediminicurvatus halobius]|uniref:hypothetical protein n=1 Tax=Sediminicurvatus halobius TaxID=2182432 RepID=UPI0011B20C4E|nr:hypothetical protein [Spiribacter halobius]UEX78618.1 hypothetical protein LMH63_02945 [Spiribacter halobius]
MRISPARTPGTTALRPVDGSHADDDMHAAHFQILRERWDEGKNPVAALDALAYAVESGVYPPTWVIDWLGGAAVEYLDNGGRADFNELLGLRRGRGKANPVQAQIDRDRMEKLALAVWIWNRLLGVSIGDAAYRAVRRAEARDEETVPDVSWVEDQCRRKWLRHFDAQRGVFEEIFSSDDAIKAFVASFPSDARAMG